MDMSNKIKALLLEKNMSNLELSKTAGVPNSTLADILKGKTTRVSINAVISIADALGVDVEHLLYDAEQRRVKGGIVPLTPSAQRIGRAYEAAPPPIKRIVDTTLEPYVDKNVPTKKAPSKEDAKLAEDLTPEFTELRLYTQPVAAGLGNYQDDRDYETASFADVPRRADIAVRVSGDSMEPDYKNGDIVFVETESVLDEGEIGIFNYYGDGYIKELALDPVRLVSLNKKYEDIIINQEGDIPFKTIGRVVGKAEM